MISKIIKIHFVFNILIILIINIRAQNKSFQAHIGCIRSILFTNDNAKLLSSSNDHTIKIWNISANNVSSSLATLDDGQNNIIWSLVQIDNNLIASSSYNKIFIWNMTNYTIIKRLKNEHTTHIRSLTLTLNNLLISASQDDTIKLWNISLSDSIKTLTVNSSVYCLSLLSDDLLASGSSNGSIQFWSMKNFTNIKTIYAHNSSVYSLLKLSNGYLVTGSDDKFIKIWNITNFNWVATLSGHTDRIGSLVQITDSVICSASDDKTIKLWSLINFQLIETLVTNSNSDGYRTLFYSSKLDMLAGGMTNGNISLFYNFSLKYRQNEMISTKTDYYSTKLETLETTSQTSLINLQNFDNLTTSYNLNGSVIQIEYTEVEQSTQTNGNISNSFYSTNNEELILSTSMYSSRLVEMLTTTTRNTETSSAEISTQSEYSLNLKTESFNDLSSLELMENEALSFLFSSMVLNEYISFDSMFSPHISNTVNNSNQTNLMIGFLIQAKFDLNDCLSNCSNNGKCKLGENNKMTCECDLFFDGKNCEKDLKPCSYLSCLNSFVCQNIIDKNGQLDFKCECKDTYYGKRCENKVNLCQNETCSGNGLCKIMKNETIKCQCYGIEMFEGERCEIKMTKLILVQTVAKSSYYISIITLSLLYILVILIDLDKLLFHLNK